MTIVDVKGLTKTFGKFTALDGVDLEVKKGEVFGFIGPNGAGKSTMIRVLLGMLKRDAGVATIFGRDVWSDAVEIHRKIAYVPGDVNLWPNLTGGEVIDLFASLQGDVNTMRRDELIAKFDLDPSKKCRTYSKGNRQKVALVAAFASDAELFILDEPTSGLDPLMERVFQQCVETVKAAGKSVLLSSHILSEVERLCDRVGIIRSGKLVETGTLAELRHLTRSKLYVETKVPVKGLDKFNGIYALMNSGDGWSFEADAAELNGIMTHLSTFGIKRLESAPPTLEDLFMQHYGESIVEGDS
ncbi:ABC transporter ATP-binding protein [Sporosarcina aquimarina]|uniref:ABC transporter ATP-binding protein n=1 Tax=Sporosarcina aquimarina TaxID=114975 RepID=A0ABU4FVL1_9BACL|nr:ABC transporter ATP-binding protein [Sporosarcina aquimarina]MDW0108756.1 ABC transporter ATP-binding protein [Sporosarcina aquimarina]